MTIKSATPSGSQSTRAPVELCGVYATDLAEVLAAMPRPLTRPAMIVDLNWLAYREGVTGEAVPGVRRLAQRWGVGVKAARLAVDAWKARWGAE